MIAASFGANAKLVPEDRFGLEMRSSYLIIEAFTLPATR